MKTNQNIKTERACQPFETAGKQYLETDYRQTDKGEILSELIDKTPPVSGINNDRQDEGKGDEDYVDYDQSDGFLHGTILATLREESRGIVTDFLCNTNLCRN